MTEMTASKGRTRSLSTYQIIQIIVGIIFLAFLGWRLYTVLVVQAVYGLDTWVRFAIAGLIIGGVYAVIAIGYTLVYGILFMINFAHGEIMMLGAFSGYFVFEALGAVIVNPETELSFLNAHPVIAIILAFLAGMTVSTVLGILLEKIAYRPLRGAPRLVPLISAIGSSFFLWNFVMVCQGNLAKEVPEAKAVPEAREATA